MPASSKLLSTQLLIVGADGTAARLAQKLSVRGARLALLSSSNRSEVPHSKTMSEIFKKLVDEHIERKMPFIYVDDLRHQDSLRSDLLSRVQVVENVENLSKESADTLSLIIHTSLPFSIGGQEKDNSLGALLQRRFPHATQAAVTRPLFVEEEEDAANIDDTPELSDLEATRNLQSIGFALPPLPSKVVQLLAELRIKSMADIVRQLGASQKDAGAPTTLPPCVFSRPTTSIGNIQQRAALL